MAQYYLKTGNDKIILYICKFDWDDIYKIVAPDELITVKLLTAYTLGERTPDNKGYFWGELVYMDERYTHPIFNEVKKGQPLSDIRQLLEANNLNMYEYDISVNGINIFSYYHDDAIIEISDGEETDEAIKHIFRCLDIEENLLEELKRNRKKILTVEQGSITTISEEIEDFFEYLNDQYYVKYPECYLPGRMF